jgi:hypothetical protein
VKPVTAAVVSRRSAFDCGRDNTEISSEDRAILAIAGFVCFISLLCGLSELVRHYYRAKCHAPPSRVLKKA